MFYLILTDCVVESMAYAASQIVMVERGNESLFHSCGIEIPQLSVNCFVEHSNRKATEHAT
jgi:hypothetical protein